MFLCLSNCRRIYLEMSSKDLAFRICRVHLVAVNDHKIVETPMRKNLRLMALKMTLAPFVTTRTTDYHKEKRRGTAEERGRAGEKMLMFLLSVLLHSATSMAAPGPCAQVVSRLEAELSGLMEVVREQHRYIQELHRAQTSQLQGLPHSFMGTGNLYRDCSEIFADGNVASGLYVIRPDGAPYALGVYCDMSDGGGWTVFQRRKDGTENFDRAWVEYKHGFGDLFAEDGEFWLGNDPLHHLTSQGEYELRINMEDFENNQRFAEYKNFKVDGEKDAYQLHVQDYSGNAGDAFGPSELKFSTFDRPSFSSDEEAEEAEEAECTGHSRAGWWFSRCGAGNLNGHYYRGPDRALSDDGVVWYTWRGWWYSIKSVVMMVRATDLQRPGSEQRPAVHRQ